MKKAVFAKEGFTLIEMLIVMAMFGIFTAAVYTLYQTHQKTAYAQEEVVEVQQNLRIAMDGMTKDIRMAGALARADVENPIDGYVNGASTDEITINTASADGIYARIASDVATAAAATLTLTLENPEAVDLFNADATSGDVVRIIRPTDNSEPISATFRITASNRAASTVTIVQTDGANFTAGVNIVASDTLVKTTTTAPNPNTIKYSVVTGGECPSGQSCIARNSNGTGDSVIAQYITDLELRYITDSGKELDAPVVPSDMGTIRAVRVTITGQTPSALSGGAKTRTIESIVKLRNRR